MALTGSQHPGIDALQQRNGVHTSDGSSVNDSTAGPQNSTAETPKSPKRRESGASRDGIRVVRDLNLRPDGKQSFDDFIAEKRPRSNEDKYAVVVYYLEVVLELASISADHVGTVFRLTKDWREPSGIGGALRATASRKGTIDTSEPAHIRATVVGRNFVEHDLPAPDKQRKK